MDFINELNENQREAVVNTDGPTLVIAGAGSGKTRVLTYRIANLLSKGVPAYRILALTFTNKAAREMQKRIATLVGQGNAANLWMGTFHSIFSKILRVEAEHLGYTSNFTIYDSQDSKNLIKSIVKDLKLDDKVYKPNDVLGRISMAKNNLVVAQAYAQSRAKITSGRPSGQETHDLGNIQVLPSPLQAKRRHGFRRPPIANEYSLSGFSGDTGKIPEEVRLHTRGRVSGHEPIRSILSSRNWQNSIKTSAW